MTVLAHSGKRGDGHGHTVLVKSLFLLAALMCLLLPAASVAQTPGSGLLVLSDDSPTVDAAPYVYVTRDDGGKLDLKSLFAKYQQGWRGDLVNGSVIPLGTSGIPHWIILNVRNESWTDKWVLSFGQHLTGRIGLLKKIFLYEHTSHTTYIDNVNNNGNPYVGEEGQGGTYITLNIPRGQTAMFFLYAVPEAGMPATIAPRLMTEAAFAKSLSDPLQSTKVMNFFFAAMVGFFIAVIVFHRYWGAFFFLVYYAAQIALFNYLNGTLYSDLAQAGDIAGALNVGVSVASLLLARSFLNIGRAEYLQNRIIIVIAIANVIAGGVAVLMPHDLFIFPLLMYGPGAATQLFLFLLSMAQGYTGRAAAMPFAMAWLCSLGGTCVSILDAMGILPPVTPMIAGYWYGLIPQGAILVGAAARRAQLTQADSGRRAMDEADIAEKVAELRQSKEASDNQRLRRLIEHEREVMTELRERESKQNDEMRKAMSAADDANRAKSAFLAVISHEIRTPMSGIMGMVRLLLDSNLPPQQKDYAQTIQDSGDAMLSLLNDILDFEKIESGKMD
ncbi:MAG TPA: histidine kinase dimerization/phospho-acceptor domain-containing protein, partial [Patescibacteria group bacterium]|nr:histidine kinase dimerization/phospho-acceptor domain-containing protein [Patescibacteria group bacterium]